MTFLSPGTKTGRLLSCITQRDAQSHTPRMAIVQQDDLAYNIVLRLLGLCALRKCVNK